MPRLLMTILAGLAPAAAILLSGLPAIAAAPTGHDQLLKAVNDGNYADAYEGLRKLALQPDTPGQQVADEVNAAITCLRQLGRLNEIDDFREAVVAAHPKDWRVLSAVAESYESVDHYGALVGGHFERGPHRGPAKIVNSIARDRVRALQLYRQALAAADSLPDKSIASSIPLGLARALANGTGGMQAWHLQSLTNLEELPDYDDGWGYDSGSVLGAPVDDAGYPIFYSIPTSWEAARNDGERWRWALEKMVQWKPSTRPTEQLEAPPCSNHNSASKPWPASPASSCADSIDKDSESKTWALDTLAESETMARLATGIKRLSLPDDQNFIKLYQAVLTAPAAQSDTQATRTAVTRLAGIFADRRQYDRAAEYWRIAIQRFTGDERKQYQQQLDQIVGNWGRFEHADPARRPRRQRRLSLPQRQARRVHRPRNRRRQTAGRREGLPEVATPSSSIGRRSTSTTSAIGSSRKSSKQYLGEEVAQWQMPLEPRDKHFDKRITVTTPLAESRRLSRHRKDRRRQHLADHPLARRHGHRRKPMADKTYYFVADAVTGQPDRQSRTSSSSAGSSNSNDNQPRRDQELRRAPTPTARSLPDPTSYSKHQLQWLVTATTADGRFAYLGFTGVWRATEYDAQYNDVKCFTITDRPVYRPEQTVQFKVLGRHAQVRRETTNPTSPTNRSRRDPQSQGRKDLHRDAHRRHLRRHRRRVRPARRCHARPYHALQIVNHGGGSFRVEEYKKPEFEVTVDAPTEPVMLGEKITATIKAKYYFGSPVTKATVKYKVTPHRARPRTGIPPARGIGSTAPATGGSPTITLGIPAGTNWGCSGPSAVLVAAPAVSRPNWSPSTKCRSAPTAR